MGLSRKERKELRKVTVDLVVTMWRLAAAVVDGVVLLLGKPYACPGRIAFLIHDRDGTDVYRWFPAFRWLPKWLLDKIRWWLWPVRTGKILTAIPGLDGQNIHGYLLTTILTAEQMVANRSAFRAARRKCQQIVRLAENLGVDVLGLGAYSASVTALGEGLAVRGSLRITTGHAFTVATVLRNLNAVVKMRGIDLGEVTVAVVGAAGSIGWSCVELLLQQGTKQLILVDVALLQLKRLVGELGEKSCQGVSTTNQLLAIQNASIVIVATTNPRSLLTPEYLSCDTIVFDDAQPRNISQTDARRAGATVIDAGVTHHPNVSCTLDLGFAVKGDMFGCLGEIVVLASLGGDVPGVIGRPTLSAIADFGRRGEELGFQVVLRSFNKPLTSYGIEH